MHAFRASLSPLLAALALSAAAAAQTPMAEGQWSDAFDRPGLVGRVFGLGTWNGKLYAGGTALAADGEAKLGHLAEFDGERWRKVGGGIQEDVRDFTVHQGELVVAGWFSHVGETFQAVPGVARWNGSQWSGFGDGLELSWALEPEIWAVEVYQDELYAGGHFDLADGKSIDTIARWDGSSWQPVGGGLEGGLYPKVLDMHATADGELVVAGEFDTAGGQPARNIAVWDGSSWSSLGAGLGSQFSSVFALEEFGGKLYAAGNFKTAGGAPAEKIAAWDGSSWSPLGGGLPDWDISVTAYALEVFGGALYVGGNFIEADGVASSRVVRWTGTEFQGVGGVAGTDLATTAIAMTAWNGKLVVGGEFTVAGTDLYPGNGIASESVAAFDGAEWSHVGDGLGLDGGASVLLEWKGEMLAAGGFLSAGTTNSVGLATFDGASWKPLAYVLGGQVKDAVLFEGDLVITGSYDYIDGVPFSGTARLDAETGEWSSMAGGGGAALEVHDGQLYGAGLGSPRRWNGSSWETFGTPIFGSTYDLHSHDGKLYIGGYVGFSGPNGGNLISWDGSKMEAVGGGVDGTVHAMASWQGDLILGGEFDEAGGTVARRLARWDGEDYQPFGDGEVFSGFAVQEIFPFQDDLYLGGDLVLYQSPYDWIAKWDADEGLQALELGGPLNEALNAPATCFFGDEATGELYVGGGFFLAAGMPIHGIALWETEPGLPGALFATVGAGVAGTAGVPQLVAAGSLAPGGTVTMTTSSARPAAPALMVAGFSELSLPVLGGTLYPSLDVVLSGFATDGSGSLVVEAPWNAAVPAGFELWLQTWIADPLAPYGFAATAGLVGTAQ